MKTPIMKVATPNAQTPAKIIISQCVEYHETIEKMLLNADAEPLQTRSRRIGKCSDRIQSAIRDMRGMTTDGISRIFIPPSSYAGLNPVECRYLQAVDMWEESMALFTKGHQQRITPSEPLKRILDHDDPVYRIMMNAAMRMEIAYLEYKGDVAGLEAYSTRPEAVWALERLTGAYGQRE